MSEQELTYTFEASDGVKITLQRMSDRQRTRFRGVGFVEINKRLLLFARLGQTNVDVESEQVATVEDLRPRYDELHASILELIHGLVSEPDLATVKSWDHPGDWIDLQALFGAIAEQELPKPADNKTVPTPDQVDALSDAEVSRLGESSRPKSTRGSTKPSSQAEATSSSGTASTEAKKLEIVETSPPSS